MVSEWRDEEERSFHCRCCKVWVTITKAGKGRVIFEDLLEHKLCRTCFLKYVRLNGKEW